MMKTEEEEPESLQAAASAAIATAVVDSLTKAATGDVETGEAGEGAESSEQLLTTVTKSVISGVDTKTSLSLLRRGGSYCWGKMKTSFTKQNIVDTFGRNGTLRAVCLEAVNCRKFSNPSGPDDWRKRIMANFSHFKILYLTITVALTIWSLLFNLWIMSGIILLVLGWYYFSPLAVLLCKIEKPTTIQKITIMVPVSIVVALVTGIISKLIELAIFSLVISVSHASFHRGVEDTIVPTEDGSELGDVPMAVLASEDAEGFSGDIEAGKMTTAGATVDEDTDAISSDDDE